MVATWIDYFVCFQYGQCMVCNGFHGSNFGQPVCSSCHLFLFSNDINLEDGEQEVYNEVIIDLAWESGIKVNREPVAQYCYNLACAPERFQTVTWQLKFWIFRVHIQLLNPKNFYWATKTVIFGNPATCNENGKFCPWVKRSLKWAQIMKFHIFGRNWYIYYIYFHPILA